MIAALIFHSLTVFGVCQLKPPDQRQIIVWVVLELEENFSKTRSERLPRASWCLEDAQKI